MSNYDYSFMSDEELREELKKAKEELSRAQTKAITIDGLLQMRQNGLFNAFVNSAAKEKGEE